MSWLGTLTNAVSGYSPGLRGLAEGLSDFGWSETPWEKYGASAARLGYSMLDSYTSGKKGKADMLQALIGEGMDMKEGITSKRYRDYIKSGEEKLDDRFKIGEGYKPESSSQMVYNKVKSAGSALLGVLPAAIDGAAALGNLWVPGTSTALALGKNVLGVAKDALTGKKNPEQAAAERQRAAEEAEAALEERRQRVYRKYQQKGLQREAKRRKAERDRKMAGPRARYQQFEYGPDDEIEENEPEAYYDDEYEDDGYEDDGYEDDGYEEPPPPPQKRARTIPGRNRLKKRR